MYNTASLIVTWFLGVKLRYSYLQVLYSLLGHQPHFMFYLNVCKSSFDFYKDNYSKKELILI